jgi:hypothetical protein
MCDGCDERIAVKMYNRRMLCRCCIDAAVVADARLPEDKIEKALDVIRRYGGIDGNHHKAWVLDQAVRALTGDRYAEWVKEACDGEDGPNTYDWDVGIPP